MSRRHRRAGRTLAVAAALVAVGAGTAAATGFSFGLSSVDSHTAAGAQLPPATAQVTRQTLVDTQAEDGTLAYAQTMTVAGRTAGTVTDLPAPGTLVKRGNALLRMDNAPVLLLYGKMPAYRALATGTRGPDVRQFEQNLAALGYKGFTVDDSYSAATATAVKQWQAKLGLPRTGMVDLGRVVYASGPMRVDSLSVAVGATVGPGTTLLTCSGAARVANVELSVSEQQLARAGAPVSVTLPDGSTVAGRITALQTVIKPAEGQNPAQTKIEVTVAIANQKPLAGLDAASVSVGFTAAQRQNVLTVPVGALLALSEGGYGVQVVSGGSTKIVAVQTGLFAGGRVEVFGDGLAEGMTVGVPS